MGRKIKITTLRCPNCNSEIEIDDNVEKGECPVCHAKFILEEEQKPKGRLDKIIDFFDRQIDKHRQTKKEKELKKEQEKKLKQEENKKSLSNLGKGFLIFMIILFALSFLLLIMDGIGIVDIDQLRSI